MNKMLKQQIQKQLEEYDITPNRVLGQNFLIDERVIGELVDAADISKKDLVVEVGPGTGVVTRELAKQAKKVIAVEKDPKLVKLLQKEFKEVKNVTIIEGDILDFKIPNDKSQIINKILNLNNSKNVYKVIGAIPYYLTSRLFRHFLQDLPIQPVSVTFVIQKEVAQKIVAKPPHSNLLAVSVQFYGEPHIVRAVSKSAFWPRPKVDSAILVVDDISKPNIDEKNFFTLLKAGFSSPRKQLATNLIQKLKLPPAYRDARGAGRRAETEQLLKKLKIDPSRRAQTLTIEEWKKLTQQLNDKITK